MTTTYDFNDGNGPVPAHEHTNGGGWVAETARVTDAAYVGPDAEVFGHARVFGEAMIYGYAKVYGLSRVYDTAMVYDNARVYGYAKVFDDAEVYGHAEVYGLAKVFDDAEVYGLARVYGHAEVYDNARVYGHAIVKMTPPKVIRSDGYSFIAVPDMNGEIRIIAGCRYFTLEEAHKHWTATRGGTDLGDETMVILEYLKIRASKIYS